MAVFSFVGYNGSKEKKEFDEKMTQKWNIDTLAEDLIKRSKKGELANKEGRLPSENKMLNHYQVSRYSLREALNKLSKLGYIYKIQGRGSYIHDPQYQGTSALHSNLGYREDLAMDGKKIQTVTAKQRLVSLDELDFFPGNQEFSTDQKFIEILRYRSLLNKPYLIERSYYIPEIVGDIPEAALYGSMFYYLAKEKKLKVSFIDKFIRCDLLTSDQAQFFHLDKGMPTLAVRDDSYLREGQLMAFSKISYDYRDTTLYMHKKIDE